MRRAALVLSLLAPAAAATASAAELGFVSSRAGQSLDGPWHVIVDPYDNGAIDYQGNPRPNGYFKNQKPRSAADLIEYDFDRSPTLNVPGDWNSQRPELLYYEGPVWYQRTFDHAAQGGGGGRLFLRFGAAAQRATVWLNGDRLGDHEGGFTPFAFEITGRVRARGNVVVVRVDNTRRAEAIPALNTDWWNYGGLTREVRLVETPAVFVRDALVQLERGGGGALVGWVAVDGARAGTEVTVEIPEARVKVRALTDGAGRASFRRPADALTRWTPEAPKLYDVTIAAAGDRVHDAIGFRTIEARGSDILLNGRPIFLRGISMHEEAPRRGGRATSRADAETLLGWAKELGCNFVRLAHYPHNEEMTRAADRMGLLVWSEIPVYWTIAWDRAETLAAARRQLGEEIARDRNRASVILWSIANETPVTEARTRFLRTLVDDAHALDATRLVTAALERRYLDARTIIIDDPLGAALDVIGCNEYIGWYDGLPDKCDGLTWKSAYQKPLIMSELGADAKSGLHGGARDRFTEDYQADFYRHQLAMLLRIPFLRGMTPWILVDFRSPRRPLPGVEDGWNRKGLLTNDGTKKQAYQVLQQFYRERSDRP
jgi:beta-glucuronidase